MFLVIKDHADFVHRKKITDLLNVAGFTGFTSGGHTKISQPCASLLLHAANFARRMRILFVCRSRVLVSMPHQVIPSRYIYVKQLISILNSKYRKDEFKVTVCPSPESVISTDLLRSIAKAEYFDP